MSKAKPRGWNVGATDTRFADVAPSSYDKKTHSVDCVISMGSPVVRFYGTEVLRIDERSVDLERMKNGSMIPLLDSHQNAGIHNALGRFKETWIKRGALMGKIIFNQTPNGQLAEGMVERGEIAGISAGYQVREWEITDGDGKVVDPDSQQVRWEDNLTFTATRWALHEGSLVSVPADHLSGIRSIGTGADRPLPQVDELRSGAIRITKRFGDCSISYDYPDLRKTNAMVDVRARMKARQTMSDRMSRD